MAFWACCCPVDSAPAFLTLGAFFVDSVNGNDSNDGLTAETAIQSLPELARRFNGKTFAPSVTTFQVNLAGTFPSQFLQFDDVIFTGPTVVTIQGTATLLDTGTVTAIQAWNGAAAGADGTRGQVTDAGQDFTPWATARNRIRLTSGASSGAVSNVASLGGGATIANTGQFSTIAPATANPAINDTYAIESLDTVIAGWSIHTFGPGTVRVRDISFTSVASPAGRNGANVGENETKCLFFGCRFDGTVSTINEGKQRFSGCSFEGGLLTFDFGKHSFLNNCFFNFIQFNSCNVIMQAGLFDGGGARNAACFAGNGAYFESIGGSGNFGTAHYGVINGTGTALLTLEDQAQAVYSNAAANLIGATGNTVITGAILARNGCGASYVTKGKATGVAPGVTDVTISGTGMAWAAVPFGAALPNNGFVNVRQ